MQHARSDYDNVQEITTNGTTRRIPADEPVFLIRGQDALGAAVVRKWASLAARAGVAGDMVAAALEHADKMEAWPVKKLPDAPAAAVKSSNTAAAGWEHVPLEPPPHLRFTFDAFTSGPLTIRNMAQALEEVMRLRHWISRIDDATAYISSASIDTFRNINAAAQEALAGKPPRKIVEVQKLSEATVAPPADQGEYLQLKSVVSRDVQIGRLQTAIEGELEGLVCGDKEANVILTYVETGMHPDEIAEAIRPSSSSENGILPPGTLLVDAMLDNYAKKKIARLESEIATMRSALSDRREVNPRGMEWKPTHRHLKRGTSYRVLGEGKVQVSTGELQLTLEDGSVAKDGACRVLCEGDLLTVYQAEDGTLWIRFPDEFSDGRFEAIGSEQPTDREDAR